jgi:hypothetical protein
VVRKILRVEMLLPFSVEADDVADGVREARPVCMFSRSMAGRESSLRIF